MRIPISLRARPTDDQPTPQQADIIDQLIDRLDGASDEAEAARDDAIAAKQAIEDMGVESETLPAGQEADVEKIVDPETGAVTLRFGIPEGKQGIQGDTGPYYIPSVSSDGTISWTNNGDLPNPESQNIKGDNGISPDVEVAQITGGHRVTITDAEGEHSFNVIDGVDGVSPVVTITNITGGHRVSIADATGTHEFDVTNGTDGENGVTFTPEVSEEGVISWTNDGGLPNPESVSIKGTDGISPAVSVSEITGGHEVTITDADHPSGQSFNVMDGRNGDPGTPGEDGYSPLASVSKSGNTATITVTDKNGTTTANVTDGQNGEPGADGTTFTPSVAQNGDISWTNDGGKTNPQTVNIKGPAGQGVASGGTAGQMLVKKSGTDYDTEWANQPSVPVQDVQIDGTSILSNGVANVPMADANNPGVVKIKTYSSGIILNSSNHLIIDRATDSQYKASADNFKVVTPYVQHLATFYGLSKAAGDTSQSASSNAVGTYTESAKSAISQMLDAPETVSGSTPSITAKAGVRYICGECSTLDITVPSSGIIDVVFQSGSTPTVLTVTPPTGMTMKWSNGFDPTSLDANTTYKINIMDGIYGVVGTWN